MKKQNNILAIDLGTSLGFAVGSDQVLLSGVLNLKKFAQKGAPVPFGLFEALNSLNLKDVSCVVVEIVRSHGRDGVRASHFFGALLACLQHWCFQHKKNIFYLEVGTIKKMFTGNGRASKKEMRETAVTLGYSPKNSDHADALAIWTVARDFPELMKDKI